MRKRMMAAGLLLGATLASGCFDVEQRMKLNKDLSGEVGMSMSVNMEPMVLIMLQLQREMSGQKGAPTAAEIEKAKKEFLASGKMKKTQNVSERAEMEKSLPPGIRLLDTSFKEDGLKMNARFTFGFDHVSKLAQIQMSGKDATKEADAGPGGKNPFDRPFPNLQIKDEGSTLLLTMEATNPAAEQKKDTGDMKLDPAMTKQIEEAFKGLRVAFRIDAPFQVIETNATRREGQTLFWEYDLKTFEKMTPAQLAQGIRVRFKK